MSASRLKQSTKRHNANISMAYGCTIDTNVYCYRMVDGKQVFNRVKLGRGWENTPFDVTKLSCYEKGEESMTHRTGYHKQWLPWDELMPQVEQMLAEGKGVPEIAQRLGIKKDTLWKRLYLNKKKAQTPPEPTGDQTKPAQSEASAPDIVPKKEITVKDVLLYEIEQQEASYATTDNDYNEREDETRGEYTAPLMGERAEREDVPQRVTLTSCQYNAMLNDTADRLSALAIFCENQAVEQLRQDWAVDIFKHSRLSRERKLELIGQLLDWRAGA